MQERNVSQKCQDEAVENLASCASDDSMAVKIGCCSTDCSTGIKKVCHSNCLLEPLGQASVRLDRVEHVLSLTALLGASLPLTPRARVLPVTPSLSAVHLLRLLQRVRHCNLQ